MKKSKNIDKSDMADIVTEMLRYGKSCLITGFTQKNLTDHLTGKGFKLAEVQNTISLYFSNYFAYQVGEVQNRQTTNYFLKPNGYFDLLQIESTTESRRQSKNANRIATISIIITGLLALAAILITLLSTPNVKLNNNEQLKLLIDSNVKNRKIIKQTQTDIELIEETLDTNLNNNKQLNELIDNLIQNRIIMRQTQRDVKSIRDSINTKIR